MWLRRAIGLIVGQAKAQRPKAAGRHESIASTRRADPGADDTRLAVLEGRINQLEATVEQTRNLLRSVEAVAELRLTRADRRMDHAALLDRVHAVTAWVESEQLSVTTTVSVVLATRNRCELLARAIDSVLAQVYPHWELVVVDDGSTDDTPALLQRLAAADDRFVVVTSSHAGSGAARNAGLAVATGDVVCYLDDDNTMQPLWLKAVAWAFAWRPSLEVLYGAQLIDAEPDNSTGAGNLPYLRLEPYDRRRLESFNYIDLGVMAHRRTLPGARFDETLTQAGDWDLFLRLTEDRLPLALPVVASIYHVSGPNRITHSSRRRADVVMPARIRRRSRLRTLAYTSRFPLVSDTHVREEMEALAEQGAALAWCATEGSPSSLPSTVGAWTGLEVATDAFAPDLIILHDETFVEGRLAELDRANVPFALRMHELGDPLAATRVGQHRLCVGVWAYPYHARFVEGAHRLAPLATARFARDESDLDRRIVLAASAGSPRRDWATLVHAFAQLADDGADCRIAVARVPGHDDLPDRLRQLVEAAGAPITLSVDVPHDKVVELMVHSAAVVYTLRAGEPLSMPRSIIEGMRAGASVVLPARPEAPLVGGRGCRTYDRPGEIVRHVTQILAGGPTIEEERRFNRGFAEREFADPVLAASFAAQLADAVTRQMDG